MKRVVLLFYCLFMLTGCASDPKELDAGMQLRSELLKASSCSFTAQITASYDDRICRFSVDCQSDPDGDISYQVLEPDSISGITGNLSGEGGQITFDDVALTFPLMGGIKFNFYLFFVFENFKVTYHLWFRKFNYTVIFIENTYSLSFFNFFIF